MKRQLEDEQLQRSPRSAADTQRQMFQKAAQNFTLRLAADQDQSSEPMDLTACDSSPDMVINHGFQINTHPMVMDNYLQSTYPQQSSASSFIANSPVVLQGAVNDNAGGGDKPMPPLQPLQGGQRLQIKQERQDDREEIQIMSGSHCHRNNKLLAINEQLIGNSGNAGQESDSSDDNRNPDFHERLLEISKDEVRKHFSLTDDDFNKLNFRTFFRLKRSRKLDTGMTSAINLLISERI